MRMSRHLVAGGLLCVAAAVALAAPAARPRIMP